MTDSVVRARPDFPGKEDHHEPIAPYELFCAAAGIDAVAGAGSLVTRDIPDYEIHVGTPARFMKRVRED